MSTSIANLSIGMNMVNAKAQSSVSLLSKVMTQSAEFSVAMLDMLPAVGVNEVGGLLDVKA